MWVNHENKLRKKLIQVAKGRKTITYEQLMKEFNIPWKEIGNELGKISLYEDSKGRPLLSAIVVRKGSRSSRICPNGSPGSGFFGIPTPTIPAELRRPESERSNPVLTGDELRFVRSEQDKVWRYWQTHEDDEE